MLPRRLKVSWSHMSLCVEKGKGKANRTMSVCTGAHIHMCVHAQSTMGDFRRESVRDVTSAPQSDHSDAKSWLGKGHNSMTSINVPKPCVVPRAPLTHPESPVLPHRQSLWRPRDIGLQSTHGRVE